MGAYGKPKETRLQMLQRLTSGPKTQALAWVKKVGTKPEHRRGVIVEEALAPDVLEQVSWVLPNFAKIEFVSLELLHDSLFYYFRWLRKRGDREILGELNYQQYQVDNKDFPYEGSGSQADFLKRMRSLHWRAKTQRVKLQGDDWRNAVTACIAFRARRLPTRPQWKWRAPALHPADRFLRAPRVTGILYELDYELIEVLCKLVDSRYFTSKDMEFLAYYKGKWKKQLSRFRFDTLEDRVHAERLSLTDFELVQRLATILFATTFSREEYSFILALCLGAHRRGPERFSIGLAYKEKFYSLFEQAVVREERLIHEKNGEEDIKVIKFVRYELYRLGCLQLPFGFAPAQKCLLNGGLSTHDSFATEGDFEEVTEPSVTCDQATQLDFTAIIQKPWDGEGDTQYLFGTPVPPPWDGEAVQNEILFVFE